MAGPVDLGLNGSPFFVADVSEDYLRALSREQPGLGRTLTAGPTGYDRNLTFPDAWVSSRVSGPTLRV